jgi:hypothetical protein
MRSCPAEGLDNTSIHLFPVLDYFKPRIVLRSHVKNIDELQGYSPGLLTFCHSASAAAEESALEGSSDS